MYVNLPSALACQNVQTDRQNPSLHNLSALPHVIFFSTSVMTAYFQLCSAMASSLSLLIQTGAWRRHVLPLRKAWRRAVLHPLPLLTCFTSPASLPGNCSGFSGTLPVSVPIPFLTQLKALQQLQFTELSMVLYPELLWPGKSFSTPGAWHLLFFQPEYSSPGFSTPISSCNDHVGSRD